MNSIENKKIYLTEKELPMFSVKYYEKLEENGVPEEFQDEIYQNFLKNYVIVKYSKDWQDKNLQYWIDLILDVPGGYWQVQELINQPHVEYQHYNFKQKMSYEKGNVSKHRANIELKKENREAYNFFHSMKDKKIKEKDIIEINVDGDFVTKIPKDL